MIDMRATIVNGSIHKSSGVAVLPSVTAGLAVDLGWPGFVRTSSVIGALEAANAEKATILETAIIALEAANASLEAENINLRKVNSDLNKKVRNLKIEETQEIEAVYAEMQPITVYFPIGKAVLDEMELKHLDFYASNIIEKAGMDPDIEIVIMGSADSNTGTEKRNKYLSEARGEYILKLLEEKYGIYGNNVVMKTEIVKSKDNPALDRAAVISFK